MNFNNLKLIFKTSTPLFILLFFRFTGTSTAEYEANFRSISGEVKGPYLMLYENFDLITNDSLKGTGIAYNELTALLIEHELYRPYKKYSDRIKSHDMNWGTNQFDSLRALPSKIEWEQIKAREEGVVYSRDTVFHSDVYFPIDIPIKLSVYRSISARVFFSLGDNPDRLQIVFPDKEEKEDPYGLYKRVRMSLGGVSSGNFESLEAYNSQLNEFVGEHKHLTAKRLNSRALNARVYKVWDENENLIFEDEEGLEGLEYQNGKNGLIDILSFDVDKRFILWYDNWYIKLLMVIQVLIYLTLFSDFWSARKEKPTE